MRPITSSNVCPCEYGIFGFVLIFTQANLTLAGIAGIFLSIGMAVDANVVIFERMKEEIDLGKSAKAAIKGGFNRAFAAMLDSNVTTIIGYHKGLCNHIVYRYCYLALHRTSYYKSIAVSRRRYGHNKTFELQILGKEG